ncbi:MAG: universal stress protein [Syntrophobacteraceae bacterium]
MADSERERVLIPVDGSQYALNAVQYATSILDPHRFGVVLFHVLTRVPESFLDLEKMPAYRYRIVNVDAWEQEQEKTIRDFMDSARGMLAAAGFPEEAVTVRIDERKVGIARDVAAESRNGYRAVVVGRQGMSELKDFMLGSIAHKILELAPIPVWIVGGEAAPKKVLMCMDNSEGAMIAARHLSEVLGATGRCDVVLFHAVRGFSGFRKFIRDMFGSEGDQSAVENIEKELNGAAAALAPSFDKAAGVFAAAGTDPARISRKIVPGAGNSGNTIIEEAEKGGFDTIVVGRRGISRAEEFFMGRVSNKVVHLAKATTVWVVS